MKRGLMKTAALLIAAVILLLLLPASILAIDQFRLTDQEDPFNVTTAANVTLSTVTLSQELYGDETRNASVSSNVTDDAPIASSYNSATQVLTVTGLQESETRRLTVEYKIDRLGDYFAAGTGAKVLPVLLILGILCIIGGACYLAFRRGD